MDLAETTKHLAQRVSEPREFDFTPLKRAARYLVGKPKAALRLRRQKHVDKITVFVDSDFAVDPVSRKSTTGLVAQIVNHTVKSGSSYFIDVQVAMLRVLFFARLVQWCTAPLVAVLQAGDGHATSWTTALRRDLAWLDRTKGCGEFSDTHDGDCSDWVAFARDKPAQWKTCCEGVHFVCRGFYRLWLRCPTQGDADLCGLWQGMP